MDGKRFLLAATHSAVFFGLLTPVLVAQVASADLVGQVTDASRAVISSVNITVENASTGLIRRTTTDESGNWTITALPIGTYRLRAEHAGFKAAALSEIVLAASDRRRVDIVMEIGAVEQSVEVVALSPALQADSSSIGALVTSSAVQNLPLNGRNFIRLAQLVPGANESVQNAMSSGNRPDDRRRTSSLSVNGMHDYANNFMIDGMDNNERAIGTMVLRPSMDALAEFRVQTNLYSAELGRTAGGVVNLITKSGTNDLHGSLFEFLRNENLDAKNFFAPAGPLPMDRQNQFGGSAGGAIRKNQLFFFGDYEGFRYNLGQIFTSTVPTPAMRAGNFSGVAAIFDPLSLTADPTAQGGFTRTRFPNDTIPMSRQDPAAAKVAALYPAPLRAGLANNYTYVGNKKQRDDTGDVRFDWRKSDRDTLYGRYSVNNTNTTIPSQMQPSNGIEVGGDTGAYPGQALQMSQGFQVNEVHIFSPELVLQLRVGYERYALQSLPINYGKNLSQQFGIPNANFDLQSSGLTAFVVAGYRGLGDSNFIPEFDYNNMFQYNGDITRTKGSHNMKFGADLRRRQINFASSNQPRGQLSFDANFTNDPTGQTPGSGNAIASMLIGYPAGTLQNFLAIKPGLRSWEFGAYAQDDWRITRSLTMNIGIRYDIFTPFTEVAGRLANVNLQTGKLMIPGQDGVNDAAGLLTEKKQFAPRFGFAYTVTPKTVIRGGYGITYFPSNFGANSQLFRNPPYVALYTVSTTTLNPVNRVSDGFPVAVPVNPASPVGSIIADSLDLRPSYAHQYNLTIQRDFAGFVATAAYVASLVRHQTVDYAADNGYPGPGAIAPRRPYYNLYPNVSGITLENSDAISNYHAMQLSLEHRLSRGLTAQSSYTWGHSIDDGPPIGGGKPGSGSTFPQFVNNRAPERGRSDIDIRQRFVVMVNYEFPVVRSLHGISAVLVNGWMANGALVAQTGVPFTPVNATARANTGGSDRPNRIADGSLPSDQRTVQKWFDTSAFAPQALYTVGNSGRNILSAPPLRQLDFSVFKQFKLSERFRLEFRSEAFNLTNTPNLGIPAASLGASTFGTISDTGNTQARQLQFALKLLF
jgi:Carboxypeptidase regulatory-like domain/TonB dependent receptor